MRHWTRAIWLFLTPTLLLTLTLAGCSGKEDIKVKRDRREKDGTGDGGGRDGGGAQIGGALSPIKGTGEATLTGVVKLAEGGDPPYDALTAAILKDINAKESDAPHCLKGTDLEKSQFLWIVDKKTRGVANVFVWLRPEDDDKQFFDVSKLVKEDKWINESKRFKTMDQPHCAFIPHALVLFPRYVDPEKKVANYRTPPAQGGSPATGQEFKVKNSSPLAHNTDWAGGGSDGGNKGVPPISDGKPGEMVIGDIKPSYKAPVAISCKIHPWMKAWVWAFDHPFAAVTDKEGKFKIEGIPAGVKLRVVAWHAAADPKFINGGQKGEEITLKDSENTKNFEIKYSKGE
jgi:hypothetical protein